MPRRAPCRRASTPTAEPGSVVVLGFGFGRLRLSAPCRVVSVVDEPAGKK
ncbi:MAG: DUF1990 family protein [Jiangellaceae bacterium]